MHQTKPFIVAVQLSLKGTFNIVAICTQLVIFPIFVMDIELLQLRKDPQSQIGFEHIDHAFLWILCI